MKKFLLALLCLMLIGLNSVSADTKTFYELSGVDADEVVRIDIQSGSTGLTVISVESKEIIQEIYGIFENGNYAPVEKKPGSSAGGWLYDVNFRTDVLEEPVFSYTLFTGSSEVDGVRYRADNAEEIRDVIKKYVDSPFDYEGILVGSGTPSAEAVTPSEWAKKEVEDAENAGIIPAGFTHMYRNPITRRQFCELAYCVLDEKDVLTAVYGEQKFTDTTSAAVGALASAGIVAGRSDTEFAPYEYITREEAAVILSKMIDALKLRAGGQSDVAFKDDTDISDWAKDYVYDCFRYGVMIGTDNGFEPKGTYTVEQAIATMVRLYNRAPDEYSFADKLNMQMPEDENYMFSPYSIKLALAMAANGAKGETGNEIMKILGITDMDLFNNMVKDQASDFAEMNGNELEVANSVWINTQKTNRSFSENFKTIVSQYYGGTAGTVFGTAEPVNEWVSEKTHGMIDEILNDSDFTSLLVNALYFKGRWDSEFDPAATENREFTSRDGTKTEIPFMNGVKRLQYASRGGVEAVRLPYQNDNTKISMYIIKGGSDHINPEKFMEKAEFKTCDVTVSVPKFKTEYSCSMAEALQAMGINRAFTPSAQFEPMFDKESAFIGDVLHKTYINMDEEGTEAAAATAVVMLTSAGASEEYEKVEFVADEPFTYVIYDETHGEFMFVGEYAFSDNK